MSGRVWRGLGVGALMAALWLGTIAAPASAANHVRWVNDGGSKGPSACATAPYSSIQDAIDASSNGDTVYVCPGTYHEQITVDQNNLLLKSRPRHAAKIVAPPVMDQVDAEVVVVRLNGWGDRLVGFDIGIPSGEVVVNAASANPSLDGVCTPADAAVWATNGHQRVNRNVIHPIGPNSLTGECGYDFGIVFAPVNESVAASGTILTGPEVSRAGHNKLTDFKWGGILADGPATKVQIDHNRLTFLHTKDPECVGCTFSTSAGLRGLTLSGALDALKVDGARLSPFNGVFDDPFGIGAENGAAVDVTYNNVHSGFNFFGDSNSVLFAGIWLLGQDSSSRVRANNVTNAAVGVLFGYPYVSAAGGSRVGPAVLGGGGTISRNIVMNNFFAGIALFDFDTNVANNTATANFGSGIEVYGADNNIHDNNFAFNINFTSGFYDCLDDTAGDVLDVLNTWNNNLGLTSAPEDLCTAPALPPTP